MSIEIGTTGDFSPKKPLSKSSITPKASTRRHHLDKVSCFPQPLHPHESSPGEFSVFWSRNFSMPLCVAAESGQTPSGQRRPFRRRGTGHGKTWFGKEH